MLATATPELVGDMINHFAADPAKTRAQWAELGALAASLSQAYGARAKAVCVIPKETLNREETGLRFELVFKPYDPEDDDASLSAETRPLVMRAAEDPETLNYAGRHALKPAPAQRADGLWVLAFLPDARP